MTSSTLSSIGNALQIFFFWYCCPSSHNIMSVVADCLVDFRIKIDGYLIGCRETRNEMDWNGKRAWVGEWFWLWLGLADSETKEKTNGSVYIFIGTATGHKMLQKEEKEQHVPAPVRSIIHSGGSVRAPPTQYKWRKEGGILYPPLPSHCQLHLPPFTPTPTLPIQTLRKLFIWGTLSDIMFALWKTVCIFPRCVRAKPNGSTAIHSYVLYIQCSLLTVI